MPEPFRNQHSETAGGEKRDQRAILRLRHLRPTQHVLRRCMRDHREPKRTRSHWPKQERMRGHAGIGRRNTPLLLAQRHAFIVRHAQGGLSLQRRRDQANHGNQRGKDNEQPHGAPEAMTERVRRAGTNQTGRISCVTPSDGSSKRARSRRYGEKINDGSRQPVLFRYTKRERLMQKVHSLTDN